MFIACAVLSFGLWMGVNAKTGPQSTMGTLFVFIGTIALLIMLVLQIPAHAHDNGQWNNADPTIRQWYKSLMQPDYPTSSCCGEADAYWADEVHVRGGNTYAVITDDRDDGPLGRPHIPNGTEVEVPNHKLKWDSGNPTGHNILFISHTRHVFCFVQGSGT
jgi:hypothetical protein